MTRNLHRLAEERSIEFHRVVARRLEKEPWRLDVARERLDQWIAKGGASVPYAIEWRRLLDLPLPELQAFLVDTGERARALRQSTPFAGVLSPRERWRLWAEVRERFEREEAASEDETREPAP